MSYLEIENVTKRYPGNGGVSGINLAVEKGEAICLLGASGCGKTTLLRVISGLAFPDEGRVRIDGRDITAEEPHTRDIGVVFQTWALFPHLSVFRNIEFGLLMRKIRAPQREEIVSRMLKLVGLQDFAQRKPGQLSGGQQQRVALARALAINPSVLLLDEPMSSLDFNTRIQLRQELRALQRQLGVTTVYVTHDYSEALAVADRTILLRDGTLVEEGPTKQLFDRPTTEYGAKFLGLHNVLPVQIASYDARQVTVALPGGYSGTIARDKSISDQGLGLSQDANLCLDQWSPRFVAFSPDGQGLPCVVDGNVVEHGYTKTRLKLENTNAEIAIRSAGISNFEQGERGRLIIDWSKASLLLR